MMRRNCGDPTLFMQAIWHRALALGVALAGVLLAHGVAHAQVCTETTAGVTTPVTCTAPPVAAAVQCNGVNAERNWTSGVLAARLERVTLPAASAPNRTLRCNDGSPAVYYLRPATTFASRNKWLILFEGGGTAFDSSPGGTLDSGMSDRWQGIGSLLHCKQKMSTDVFDETVSPPLEGRDGAVDSRQPLAIEVGGIMHPVNSAFATWNWVFLNYCSSDHWTGTGRSVDLFDMGFTHAGTDYSGFRIFFNGHNIVEHVLDRLDSPNELADGPNGIPQYLLHKSLMNATTIVLAGDSAGGGGVQHHLDYVSDRYPQARVVGGIGAGHNPPIGQPGDPWFRDDLPAPSGDGFSDVQDGAIRQWSQVDRIGGHVDQSCLIAEAGDAWRCLLLSSAQAYLQAPHLVRQDLSDPLKVLSGSGSWPDADFRAGLIDDYTSWAGNSGMGFFAPDHSTHEAVAKSNYWTETMVACDQTGWFPNPVLATQSYDTAMAALANGGTIPKIYDGLEIIAPPFVHVIWRSGGASSCP